MMDLSPPLRICKRLAGLACAALLCAISVPADEPRKTGASNEGRTEVFKRVDGLELAVHITEPSGAAHVARPAIVLFFGGGWKAGSLVQFAEQCRYFASRGMVAIAAEYRTASRGGVKPADCVRDAKSCFHWIQANADRLGIDPRRIVVGGGSAGGHLAACVALLVEFDAPPVGTPSPEAPSPAALVLFNPVLRLAALDGKAPRGFGAKLSAVQLGAEPEALSPAHHVRAGLPPTIIFHGTADTTVPIADVEDFARRMLAAGNRCEVHRAEGQAHAFFNKEPWKTAIMQEAAGFLVTLGIVADQPRPGKSASPDPSPKKEEPRS
jgi:acetyl esterase/lipase